MKKKKIARNNQSRLVLSREGVSTTIPTFQKQDAITESIIVNHIGKGGLPILLATWDCFKKFMSLVEPRCSSPCYRTVIAKMDAICAKKKTEIISKLNRYNYSVALDEWTGCNRKSFLGCTVTIVDPTACELVSKLLFFKDLCSRRADSLMSQTKVALDQLGVIKEPFCFTADNCSVMKKAFSQLKNLPTL